jgi:hypothetical protein
MQLDSYFEFVSADEIVVCGTRIGIEVILADYFAGMNKGTQLICFGMNKGTGRIKSCVPLVHQDLKIAAIALTHDSLLLSANLRDFEQVPGLQVEDWLYT